MKIQRVPFVMDRGGSFYLFMADGSQRDRPVRANPECVFSALSPLMALCACVGLPSGESSRARFPFQRLIANPALTSRATNVRVERSHSAARSALPRPRVEAPWILVQAGAFAAVDDNHNHHYHNNRVDNHLRTAYSAHRTILPIESRFDCQHGNRPSRRGDT
jgi:hypothetical protein